MTGSTLSSASWRETCSIIASRSGSERKTSSATDCTSMTPFSSMEAAIARLTAGRSSCSGISGAACAIASVTACTASFVERVGAIAKSASEKSCRLPTFVSTAVSRRRISPVERLTTKPAYALPEARGSTVPCMSSIVVRPSSPFST